MVPKRDSLDNAAQPAQSPPSRQETPHHAPSLPSLPEALLGRDQYADAGSRFGYRVSAMAVYLMAAGVKGTISLSARRTCAQQPTCTMPGRLHGRSYAP